MYAMDFRQYDPAIGRFNSIDPVVHHSQSVYAAFDNNPVFFADPSGADAVYNWSGPNKGKYTDNGEVVDFETAMASHGLDANGKPNSEGDPGRRRARQRDRNRSRVGSGSVLFDARGQELLSHWLSGSGSNLTLDSEQWQDYMKDNEMLSKQIQEQLQKFIKKSGRDIKKGGKYKVDITFHGEIENGYSTGYQMLHGSHSSLGDTQIQGSVTYNSTTSQFDFNIKLIWNDKLDKNSNYDDDITLSNFLNIFYTPKDYDIQIIWNEKRSIK